MAGVRRSNAILAAFAAPSLPLAALGLPLVVYLPNYYSETLGLSVGMVGAAFLFVRLFDIAFDPFFGTVLDRTGWRMGRFKPWMAIGTPIVAAASAMLFMAQAGVGPFYLWASLAVVYGGYSICVLAHSAWASTLSADYNQRSRVYAFWQTGNVIGMILVIMLPVVLSAIFSDEGRLAAIFAPDMIGKLGVEQAAYAARVRAMGWFIVILLPLTALLAIRFVNEPRIVINATEKRATPGDYLRMLRRPTVLRILTADLLMAMGPGIAGSLFFFFFERVKGFGKAESEVLLMVYFCAAVVGAPVWVWLSRRFGKHQMLIASSLLYAFVQVCVFMLPSGNFWAAVPFLILAGLPYSAAPFLLRAMLADVSDEERLRTGVDRTGLLYAILVGTVKIGSALAVTTFIVLGWLGFNAHDPAQSTEAGMTGLLVLYAAAPALMGVLAALVMMKYPLTQARHAEIRAQLDGLEPAPPPTPEDIAVLQPNVAQNLAE
jgi:GPH family glycoside/pentoside/hexuronide:cation symporter